MRRWLPEPVAFTVSMMFLAAAAVPIGLLDPDVREWLSLMEPALAALLGAFAAVAIGAIGIVHALLYNARRRREAAVSRERSPVQAMAAALRGELIAAGHWLNAEAASGARRGGDEPWASAPGFVSQTVFEANAARVPALGPTLCEALTFCHAALSNLAASSALGETGARQRDVERLQGLIRALIDDLGAIVDGTAATPHVRKGGLRAFYLTDSGAGEEDTATERGFTLRRVL